VLAISADIHEGRKEEERAEDESEHRDEHRIDSHQNNAANQQSRINGLGFLDLRLSVGLPIRAGGDRHLALTVDAFNVVATSTGLVDRALLLVNPAGTIGGQGTPAVTLPLLVNPRFGTLLSRRGEPRMLRIGLGIDY